MSLVRPKAGRVCHPGSGPEQRSAGSGLDANTRPSRVRGVWRVGSPGGVRFRDGRRRRPVHGRCGLGGYSIGSEAGSGSEFAPSAGRPVESVSLTWFRPGAIGTWLWPGLTVKANRDPDFTREYSRK